MIGIQNIIINYQQTCFTYLQYPHVFMYVEPHFKRNQTAVSSSLQTQIAFIWKTAETNFLLDSEASKPQADGFHHCSWGLEGWCNPRISLANERSPVYPAFWL